MFLEKRGFGLYLPFPQTIFMEEFEVLIINNDAVIINESAQPFLCNVDIWLLIINRYRLEHAALSLSITINQDSIRTSLLCSSK